MTSSIKKFLRSVIVYLSGVYAIDYCMLQLQTHSPEKVLNLLRRKYIFHRPRSIRFMMQLYDFISTYDINPKSNPHSTQNIMFTCCTWGEAYTKKFINYLVPSLCSRNNIPAIASHHEVNFIIYCDTVSQHAIQSSAQFRHLSQYLSYEFITIPDSLLFALKRSTQYPNLPILKKINKANTMLKYLMLGALQTHALQKAFLTKDIISFLMPDIALSESFLSYALQKSSDKLGTLATAFRTNFSSVEKSLAKYYVDCGQTNLTIDGSNLTKIIIKNIHKSAKRRIVSDNNINFNPSAQLIFEAPSGYIIRSYQYHPIFLNCMHILNSEKYLHFDYLPIDKYMLGRLSNSIADFIIFSDSLEACFIELSEPDTENFEVSQQVNRPSDSILKTVYSYTLRHNDIFGVSLYKDLSSVRNFICLAPQDEKKSGFDDTFFYKLYNYTPS